MVPLVLALVPSAHRQTPRAATHNRPSNTAIHMPPPPALATDAAGNHLWTLRRATVADAAAIAQITPVWPADVIGMVAASKALQNHAANKHTITTTTTTTKTKLTHRATQPTMNLKDLDEDAQALLDENQNDPKRARAAYIGLTMAYLQQEQPHVYKDLIEQPTRPDVHEALVEITWDAVRTD